MKAAIYTLGCKVNQYESQVISETLADKGFTVVDCNEKADIYIINSCTVTASADQKTRQYVRKFKRNNPESVVILTGCMPQAFPKEAESLIEADIVIGNRNNSELVEFLDKYLEGRNRIVEIQEHEKGDKFVPCSISHFDERTRASVKIQDGCNRFCSYCIIPYSRGRVRSKPLDELKAELEAVAQNGYSEVVLVGINLSSYGQDCNLAFPDAVKLADSIDGIERVRLGSLEPDHLTDEVIEKLSECRKLCPQFHISLQSGCDKTLKAMNRHYTADEYRHLCKKLRAEFPDCTLTTDVMVGFCGETDSDFDDSLNFVKEIGFEKIHVFPYSVRKGTKAEKMDGHLPKHIKEERCAAMIEAGEEIRSRFFKSQIGKKTSVLFESTLKDGYCCGYTANYTPVKVLTDSSVCGKILDVEIISVCDDDFCGGIII